MGSSCSSIDNFIESKIYYPPAHKFYHFSALEPRMIYLSTKKGDTVSLLKIGHGFDKYLVFAHGNGDDILTLLELAENWSYIFQVNVIVFDYIGYGRSSEKKPTEQLCYDSFETVMDYVLNELNIDESNVLLFGQSLGTGIVVDYAFKRKWKYPCILVSPYKSIGSIVLDTCLINSIDKYKTMDKIGKLVCPVKIFHGVQDKLIPISHAKSLYNSLADKSLDPVWLDGVGHNDILGKIGPIDLVDLL